MRELIRNYKQFDEFIRVQLFVLFIVTLSWSLVLPIVTKLQGILWTTSMISAYLILHKLSVFIMPYFKKVSLKSSYKTLIILDIIYMLSMFIYFIDINTFIYVEAILVVIYGLSVNIFGINYSMYVMKKYDSEVFKDTQYLEQIAMACAGIIGYLIVIIVGEITKDMGMSIKFFMVFILFNLIVQFYNYNKHWKQLKEGKN